MLFSESKIKKHPIERIKQADSLVHWQQAIASPIPDFPTDKVRKEARSTKCEAVTKHRFSSSIEDTKALVKIARDKNTSTEILLMAAFSLLISRYSSQSDVVVTYYQEEYRLARFPLQIAIASRDLFSDLFPAIEEQIATAAYHIKNLSLELVARDAEYIDSIPWQFWYSYSKKLNNETLYLSEESNIYPELYLKVTEASELSFELYYDSELYQPDTVRRIANNYLTLLDSVIQQPQGIVSELNILSAAEKEQVLYRDHQTETESLSHCLHQLFEVQASQNPEAVAVICQGEQLTYGELNRQANQLARYLQQTGVVPGSFVGICIERSLLMVVAVMAILKVGGVYVPLDLSNPTSRISFILEDAGIDTIVTQTSLSILPKDIANVVLVDGERDGISQQTTDNLNLSLNLEDLAHIVYTSGSTGKPKGVMLTHGNLSHYVQSLKLAFEITPNDVYLHRGSIALIVSARQLLMPLAQGATAVVVTAEEIKDPLEFFAIIKRHGVTIVDHVPSFWRNFWGILNQQRQSDRSYLLDNQVRLVAAGGEQVTPEIYQCWRETFSPDVKLANIYGQTEGTGVVTFYPIPEDLELGFKSLPVGRPIANMKTYLLDEKLQPVPIGVAAEIHISGAGVAKGYLNRPELTAEKFASNPFSSQSTTSKRLYKTGDLGRLLPDGSIQFLGRVDRQVNIQGLRIELGEIEATLTSCHLITEAAVVVDRNRLGETLTAYVIANSKKVSSGEVRDYLSSKLPAYMIPNAFVFVHRFPQTTSGKIDYRALSTMEKPAIPTASPRDSLEAEILQLLQDILGIKNISVRDNFLEVGGNSLLAARLVTEIANRYQKDIPIASVFQAATASSLAQLIREESSACTSKSYVPIREASNINLIAIHTLGYGLEYYRPLSQHLNPAIGLCGLSSSFSNESNLPHSRDISSLADYYTQEILKIQPTGDYYLIGVSFGGAIAYETARRLTAMGKTVKFLGLIDTHFPEGNSVKVSLSFKERVELHIEKLQNRGLANYIGDRIKQRTMVTADWIRCRLYQNHWIKENILAKSDRSLANLEYLKLREEHLEVNRNYQIQPYSGHVDLFRATKDFDKKLRWQQVAHSLAIHDIPGDHLEILQEPNVRLLAPKIQSLIMGS